MSTTPDSRSATATQPAPASTEETVAKWRDILTKLDYAFQPIVNMHTGLCLGYEALLRGYDKAGFASPPRLFDAAYREGVLRSIDVRLRKRAIEKLSAIPHFKNSRLFFNLDSRLLESKTFKPEETNRLLRKYGIPSNFICFEISEKHAFRSIIEAMEGLTRHRTEAYRFAIDDFGTGHSGLKLLYFSEPNFIKIDRFFVENISKDTKKKVFVSNIIDIAHLMGVTVIAEGVENETDFYVCKEIGCTLAQGYLIQTPTLEIGELKPAYPHILELTRKDRRQKSDQKLLQRQAEYIEPIDINTDVFEVFDVFRNDKEKTFYPLVNESNEPLGLIREVDLRDYTYSRFGRELLANNAKKGMSLGDFMTKCPIADINMPAEKIIKMYSAADNAEGIVLTEHMRYVGFLDTKSLIKVINEKNLATARDQNPLTQLPGNQVIYEYATSALSSVDSRFVFVYLDFDFFKSFNDYFGFRLGDRAILMFSELITKSLQRDDVFIGHVGGDDFFLCFRDADFVDAFRETLRVVAQFRADAEAFYNEDDRNRGYIHGRDRDGNPRKIPLLTCSAAMLDIPSPRDPYDVNDISLTIARLKNAAKKSAHKICAAGLPKSKLVELGYQT
jgi:diguanylate cyclase (GGDEF)-like protein